MKRFARCLLSQHLGDSYSITMPSINGVLSLKEIHRSQSTMRGSVSKGTVSAPMRSVPSHIIRPEYAQYGRPHPHASELIALYEPQDIPGIRKAARLARKMLEFSKSLARPGVSTDAIDAATHDEIVRHGAYPTPLNYCTYPKSICTSVNNVACHGIPDSRPLEVGDLVSIDVSLYLDGFHGDNCGVTLVLAEDEATATTAVTAVAAGKYSGQQRLIEATEEAVMNAVGVCRPGACITEIGDIIEYTADKYGYSVIPNFCGHGTGKFIHMAPLILHYRNHDRLSMRPGMVFTIEPILAERSGAIFVWEDGWTAATKDGSWSAQVEHEVLITETGAEILTTLNDDDEQQ